MGAQRRVIAIVRVSRDPLRIPEHVDPDPGAFSVADRASVAAAFSAAGFAAAIDAAAQSAADASAHADAVADTRGDLTCAR
jgi:hypothetical protein